MLLLIFVFTMCLYLEYGHGFISSRLVSFAKAPHLRYLESRNLLNDLNHIQDYEDKKKVQKTYKVTNLTSSRNRRAVQTKDTAVLKPEVVTASKKQTTKQSSRKQHYNNLYSTSPPAFKSLFNAIRNQNSTSHDIEEKLRALVANETIFAETIPQLHDFFHYLIDYSRVEVGFRFLEIAVEQGRKLTEVPVSVLAEHCNNWIRFKSFFRTLFKGRATISMFYFRRAIRSMMRHYSVDVLYQAVQLGKMLGLEPDLHLYHLLMQCAMEAQEYELVINLFREIQQSHLHPKILTYYTAMKAMILLEEFQQLDALIEDYLAHFPLEEHFLTSLLLFVRSRVLPFSFLLYKVNDAESRLSMLAHSPLKHRYSLPEIAVKLQESSRIILQLLLKFSPRSTNGFSFQIEKPSFRNRIHPFYVSVRCAFDVLQFKEMKDIFYQLIIVNHNIVALNKTARIYLQMINWRSDTQFAEDIVQYFHEYFQRSDNQEVVFSNDDDKKQNHFQRDEEVAGEHIEDYFDTDPSQQPHAQTQSVEEDDTPELLIAYRLYFLFTSNLVYLYHKLQQPLKAFEYLYHYFERKKQFTIQFPQITFYEDMRTFVIAFNRQQIIVNAMEEIVQKYPAVVHHNFDLYRSQSSHSTNHSTTIPANVQQALLHLRTIFPMKRNSFQMMKITASNTTNVTSSNSMSSSNININSNTTVQSVLSNDGIKLMIKVLIEKQEFSLLLYKLEQLHTINFYHLQQPQQTPPQHQLPLNEQLEELYEFAARDSFRLQNPLETLKLHLMLIDQLCTNHYAYLFAQRLLLLGIERFADLSNWIHVVPMLSQGFPSSHPQSMSSNISRVLFNLSVTNTEMIDPLISEATMTSNTTIMTTTTVAAAHNHSNSNSNSYSYNHYYVPDRDPLRWYLQTAQRSFYKIPLPINAYRKVAYYICRANLTSDYMDRFVQYLQDYALKYSNNNHQSSLSTLDQDHPLIRFPFRDCILERLITHYYAVSPTYYNQTHLWIQRFQGTTSVTSKSDKDPFLFELGIVACKHEKGSYDKAMNYVKEISQISPSHLSSVIMANVIDIACAHGRIEDAVLLLEVMEAHNIPRLSYTYALLLIVTMVTHFQHKPMSKPADYFQVGGDRVNEADDDEKHQFQSFLRVMKILLQDRSMLLATPVLMTAPGSTSPLSSSSSSGGGGGGVGSSSNSSSSNSPGMNTEVVDNLQSTSYTIVNVLNRPPRIPRKQHFSNTPPPPLPPPMRYVSDEQRQYATSMVQKMLAQQTPIEDVFDNFFLHLPVSTVKRLTELFNYDGSVTRAVEQLNQRKSPRHSSNNNNNQLSSDSQSSTSSTNTMPTVLGNKFKDTTKHAGLMSSPFQSTQPSRPVAKGFSRPNSGSFSTSSGSNSNKTMKQQKSKEKRNAFEFLFINDRESNNSNNNEEEKNNQRNGSVPRDSNSNHQNHVLTRDYPRTFEEWESLLRDRTARVGLPNSHETVFQLVFRLCLDTAAKQENQLMFMQLLDMMLVLLGLQDISAIFAKYPQVHRDWQSDNDQDHLDDAYTDEKSIDNSNNTDGESASSTVTTTIEEETRSYHIAEGQLSDTSSKSVGLDQHNDQSDSNTSSLNGSETEASNDLIISSSSSGPSTSASSPLPFTLTSFQSEEFYRLFLCVASFEDNVNKRKKKSKYNKSKVQKIEDDLHDADGLTAHDRSLILLSATNPLFQQQFEQFLDYHIMNYFDEDDDEEEDEDAIRSTSSEEGEKDFHFKKSELKGPKTHPLFQNNLVNTMQNFQVYEKKKQAVFSAFTQNMKQMVLENMKATIFGKYRTLQKKVLQQQSTQSKQTFSLISPSQTSQSNSKSQSSPT
jgi:hypothetical protein